MVKTLAVVRLVEQLQQHGIRMVVSRGYGGKAASHLLLNRITTTGEAG